MKALKAVEPTVIISAGVDWFTSSSWRYFVFIFLLSMAVRVYKLSQVDSRYLVPTTDHELSSIAISLLETGQFADPYMLPSGPTAHLPPIFPALIFLNYRWLGLTSEAGYAGWVFIAATSSVLYGMLPWFSQKLGTGKQAGFIGGIMGGLWVVWTGHGEALTAVILALLLVLFLRRWRGRRTSAGRSFLLGAAIGAAFHLQPALLPVIIGCLLFELWWSQGRRKWSLVGAVVLGVFLSCVPWAWRNYQAFGTFFFIRSNLGLELRMGNHEGAAATMEVMDEEEHKHKHPRSHIAEARMLREVGEAAYMEEAQHEAWQWIGTHPAQFLWLTVQRAANLWGGPLHRPFSAAGVFALTVLAVWGFWRSMPGLTVPQRAAFLIPLLFYPLIYYVVAYMPRYRVPIDWILLILAGNAIWRMINRPSVRQRLSVSPAVLGLVVKFI
jgi:hypothetical protein